MIDFTSFSDDLLFAFSFIAIFFFFIAQPTTFINYFLIVLIEQRVPLALLVAFDKQC